MKRLGIIILLAIPLFAIAQTPQPDSLRLWFAVDFRDSLSELHFRPQLLNLSSLPGYFFYQIRISDENLRPGSPREKITGIVFSPPGDTVEILEKTIPFFPGKDFSVYCYLLENEFVVADTSWNFEEAWALHKNPKVPPGKSKPKKQTLAKDDFEIDVLTFNETKTPFGREFYRKFMETWQAPKGVSGAWVTIRELLTPGRYTLISVSLNNRELFQRYLVPRTEYIEQLASATAEYIVSLLSSGNYDGSLTSDELFGNSIETKLNDKL